ncbi:uncharacterized protein LOC129799845 [Phlebotomus papatasi]|uniref:uncharacterized protein LOC129799845 n=1 Tax=Phlebotomus papatasi TaxID=29031 RepID=UPI0024836D1F|nr:uncharacterized protein LOC129799845 [Phlebotomus papatasi]
MQNLEVFMSDILPLLAKINKQPNIREIQMLNELLGKSNDVFAGKIYSNMLLPILSQIDSQELRNKPEIKEHLISTINNLLKRITVDKVDCFSTILIVLLKQIYDFQTGSLVKSSEEMKFAVLECVKTLSIRTSKDVIEKFFKPKNRKIVANLLFCCVQIVEQEGFAGLKISSIRCILSFLQIDDDSDEDDVVLRSEIADVIYMLLPRILKCLMETALRDTIKGHLVIALSIKAIGRIICLVLENNELDLEEKMINLEDFRKMILEDSSKDSGNSDILKAPLSGIPEDKILRKDPQWINAVSKKLKPFLAKLIIFAQNDHVKVRKKLLKGSAILLKKCSKTLPDCLQSLLEVIFVMSFDEDNSISSESREIIRSLKSHPRYEDFVKNAEATLNSVLLTLPQSILREDDHMQILGLTLLKGSLDFIPPNDLLTLISDELFLEKLSTVMILGAEINTKQEDLLAESITKGHPWRTPKWLSNKKSQEIFEELCKSFNKPEIIEIISRHFLGIFELRTQKSNEVLLILNNLIRSEDLKGSESTWKMEFLTEVMRDIHWNLSLQVPGILTETSGEEFLTIEDVKFNIIHSCLILEAIGLCAQKLKTLFHPFLFKTFHRVLAKAGSSNSCVKAAALGALEDMKASFNLATIEEFVNLNSDYIIFYVNKFLRKDHSYDDGLGMLQIILEYSSKDSSTHFYLETILNSLLQDSAKVKDQSRLKAHFRIYQIFLTKIKHQIKEEDHSQNLEITSDDILEKWLEIWNQNDQIEEEEVEENNEPEDPDPKEPESIPSYIKLTESILKLVLKHISSKDQHLSLLSLELLTEGLLILRQKEEKLLPIVHLIWFPLTEKFKCENPVILRQCFKLLVILAKTSKDFIHNRTLSDVIPLINKYLTDVAKKSPGNAQQGLYTHTQEFKLIHTILSQYGQLISAIELKEKNLDDCLSCSLRFLDRNQHEDIQKVALEFFKSLLRYDSPMIYLKLHKYERIREKLEIN